MRRRLAAAALAGTLAALAALAALAGSSAQAGSPGCCELRQLGTFDSPLHVADAPGQPDDLFVVEQAGRIRVLHDEVKKPKPFLDIRSIVRAGGEEGLLSIAFDPDYETTRRFYVYYTDNNGDIRVDEFRRSRNRLLRTDPRSRRKVIKVKHPVQSNHNGGQAQMTDDRMLWLATGDGGGGGDPFENGQDPESLLGKLMRIDPTPAGGGPGHDIPADNPFVGNDGTRDEIWSLGLRNPFRFSFDADNGNIAIGDVGQNCWEEVNHETQAAARGANFGWDRFEGDHPFPAGMNCSEGNPQTPPPNYLDPVFEYPHGNDPNEGCSITGGYVIRDSNLTASIQGQYLYADFCGGELELVNLANGSEGDQLNLFVNSPSSFGEDRDNGQLYVTGLGGPLYALEDTP